jgi:small subunit ribosomal protein S4
VHGHFQVNGVKTSSPSFRLRAGDVITVRPRKNLQAIYRELMEASQGESMEWLAVDAETCRASLLGIPGPSDISLPVDVNMVVEFLAR